MYFKKLYSRFLYFFGNWPEKVSAFRQDLLCRSEKTAFHVSLEVFREEFVGKKNILSFLDNEQKLSACKNSILHVPRIISVKFFWKNVYFSKFSFFERIFSVFCQKTSRRIARTEMYLSTRKLGRKLICWKNCVCAILFQKWAKNFWPSGESFSAALWKLLLMCP